MRLPFSRARRCVGKENGYHIAMSPVMTPCNASSSRPLLARLIVLLGLQHEGSHQRASGKDRRPGEAIAGDESGRRAGRRAAAGARLLRELHAVPGGGDGRHGAGGAHGGGVGARRGGRGRAACPGRPVACPAAGGPACEYTLVSSYISRMRRCQVLPLHVDAGQSPLFHQLVHGPLVQLPLEPHGPHPLPPNGAPSLGFHPPPAPHGPPP